MRALVVIPVFDEGSKLEAEAERIEQSLKKRNDALVLDILIMDDGSTTEDPNHIARRYGFLYLRNSVRRGVGYAIRRAYAYGLENHYDILITMAGNNKDNPEELDRLADPICSGTADFVQGSRYLSGGNFGNMPFYRLITTRFVHPILFSFVAGKPITDSTNGFRAIKAEVLQDPRIHWHESWLDEYELEPYLFCMAIRLGYRVTEVPVTKIYPDKKLGYSKMKPITGWWSILRPLFFVWLKLRT